MEFNNGQRAEVLINALPYIKKYNNKIVVIKYGGNAMVNEELKRSVMRDIVLLSLIGIKVILVHGGGPEITEVLNKMNIKTEFKNGLRVTDRETAEIAQMVLSGKVNKELVNLLGNAGGNSVGISGVDCGMIEARMKDEELGYVGEIINIKTNLIRDLLEKNYIPVISSVGFDKSGNIYNINADTAAAWIAGELGAECLVAMTDVMGILEDVTKPETLISKIDVSDADRLIKEGRIYGGMIPKVQCCTEAIRRGVKKVFIIDGKIPHAILIEILTNEGIGTMFV